MKQPLMPLSTRLPKISNQAPYLYYKYLWNRCHRYQYNTAQIVTGSGGSGKTKFGILSAYLLNSKRFNEHSYVNSAKEFIKAIDDSRTGDSIVWDEAGVSLSARRWHSLSNILTAEVLQTYRVNKLSVFFIVPDMSFVDVQARKLMTIFSEIKRWDVSESVGWLYSISVDRKKGDVYFPGYRMIIDGVLSKMPRVVIPGRLLQKVPKEIWDAAKEKEMRFKEYVRKRSLRTIELLDQQEKGEKTIFDYINEVSKDRERYTNKKGVLDLALLQTHLGVGRTKAQQVKSFLEKEKAQPT